LPPRLPPLAARQLRSGRALEVGLRGVASASPCWLMPCCAQGDRGEVSSRASAVAKQFSFKDRHGRLRKPSTNAATPEPLGLIESLTKCCTASVRLPTRSGQLSQPRLGVRRASSVPPGRSSSPRRWSRHPHFSTSAEQRGHGADLRDGLRSDAGPRVPV